MGNVVRLKEGSTGPGGLNAAHGVLHRLTSHDFALLTGMEHEYRCLTWTCPTLVFWKRVHKVC